ncbi:MAG TPA: CRTAC1 family protein [Pirellulaceae bacterium]|nr:CRTAC1 family protein [Pirellulaceae bacterium]
MLAVALLPALLSVLLSVLLSAPAQAQSPASCPIRLTDATAASGIKFRHTDGGSGQGYIIEGMASGIATFDYDGDGLIDIYFLSGAALKGTVLDSPARDALYRNNGDWTFTDVTEQAGLGDLHHSLGVAAADYDGDGDQDLYVSNFGPNVLYRNNGDRTFTDVTEQAGVGNGNKVGAGCSFFDMDGDGDLDLYVGNYVDFTYENHVPIVVKGRHFQAGPQYYQPVADTLYRNNGDGTFTDVSGPSGIAAVAGPSMATLAFDYDDDGDADMFVCNDGKPNFLFENDGHGKFQEKALVAGLAYNFYGKAISSMGVDCGDVDNDGRLDLFVTSYQSEMPVLFRNLGGGLFEDGTSTARIATDFFAHVEWGTGQVDFDNDGDRDLFLACGHFDRIELLDDRTSLKVPNYVLMNDGQGRFTDVSKQCGSGLAVVESSRGVAFDDLDNDGDVDAVVLNSNAAGTLLRNESPAGNHWLELRLQGGQRNLDGIGARVKVVSGERAQIAEVHSGRGYQSHYGTRLHFGLGQQQRVDRIEVRWPGGSVEHFPGGEPDRLLVLKQGSGRQ